MIDLKRRLRNKVSSLGSWITLGNTAIAEIMAKSGFDWLAVDMEHGAISIETAQQLIQVIGLSGCVPLVRVGENSSTAIKQVMDAGAHGVIVPMINSKADAGAAVSAVKYPPLGTRGVGLARAQGYGFEFAKYRKWVNNKSIVIVQIEHVDAVENLDEILSVSGVDGFMVGPYDLSASLGTPGEFDNPKMTSALKTVMKIARDHNVSPGFHVVPPDAAQVRRKMREGYRFIAFSLDTVLLGTICREGIARTGGPKK